MARTAFDALMEIDQPVFGLTRRRGPWGRRRWHDWLTEGAFVPTSDVFARNGDLVIRVDLPGIDPAKDVTITLEEGELTVKGERREDKEVKDKGYYWHESSYGSFERHLQVPAQTKESDIKAEYRDGVLEIVVPKAAAPAPASTAKQIPIKTVEPAK
ncbi:MAG TPA: Hsp20/alpha crystallin family protein [Candidatus Acidoferrales bacterium]|nr:Hsp20/alpha crystallin family protein [Candidatus Acidoferrales bacterium]